MPLPPGTRCRCTTEPVVAPRAPAARSAAPVAAPEVTAGVRRCPSARATGISRDGSGRGHSRGRRRTAADHRAVAEPASGPSTASGGAGSGGRPATGPPPTGRSATLSGALRTGPPGASALEAPRPRLIRIADRPTERSVAAAPGAPSPVRRRPAENEPGLTGIARRDRSMAPSAGPTAGREAPTGSREEPLRGTVIGKRRWSGCVRAAGPWPSTCDRDRSRPGAPAGRRSSRPRTTHVQGGRTASEATEPASKTGPPSLLGRGRRTRDRIRHGRSSTRRSARGRPTASARLETMVS